MLPHSGHEVWGALYELDESELSTLDGFERGYDRVVLEVESDDGATHAVSSYTVRRKRSFRPTDAYLEKMLLWGVHWGLPAEYLDRLREIPVQAAPALTR